MVAFNINKASARDAEGIARVQVECWQKCLSAWAPQSFVERFHVETQSEKYRLRILDKEATLLVAHHEGVVIGIVGAKPNILPPRSFEQIVFGVYIAPQFQKKGVGQALMKASFLALKQRSVSNAVVFTFEANKPARKLYEKCGGQILPYTDSSALDLKIPHVSYGFDLKN